MPVSDSNHLVLAGGGHTHALILRRWALKPERRPLGLITLISQDSGTFYSSMVPGLIAGTYQPEELTIDLRNLANQAGVSFIHAEISGIDLDKKILKLDKRNPIKFNYISLNIGAVGNPNQKLQSDQAMIKPLHEALALINQNDCYRNDTEHQEFSIVGSGLASVEVSLALRNRWPKRKLTLYAQTNKISAQIKKVLQCNNIRIVSINDNGTIEGPALFCTGSFAPDWLEKTGLRVNHRGRILTKLTLQAIDHPYIFASGDCGVIQNKERPASGVWAVRAAPILAINLENMSSSKSLRSWTPQKQALQLIGKTQKDGIAQEAWIRYGRYEIGPYHWAWKWKRLIDKRFIDMFHMKSSMENHGGTMDCRGCAAKLAAQPLKNALEDADLGSLGSAPEDAVALDENWLQSVDGFPALLSDPFLNAKITTLHACSDLWASGATVASAQALITIPNIQANLQENLLKQILSGINEAIEEQRAALLGGHTLVSRDPTPSPATMGIQISLCVNGKQHPALDPWPKGGLQSGDVLLLSKPIGTGVLFAAAMQNATRPTHLDKAIALMSTSQHQLIDQLRKLEMKHPRSIHACTDVTGFGLMGHLGEMLQASNHARTAHINLAKVPALEGAINLLKQGYASSLAPSNRQSWNLLNPTQNQPPRVTLELPKEGTTDEKHRKARLELIVDPQTCGPLMLACTPEIAKQVMQENCNWQQIGTIN